MIFNEFGYLDSQTYEPLHNIYNKYFYKSKISYYRKFDWMITANE
jgi:hypothetical protein